MKVATLILLTFPLQAAIITNIQMGISVDGGGPQSSCAYTGPGPTAECTVIGPRGQGQAQASVDGSQISVGAGGSGASSRVYVTATLESLYSTAFTGNLLAMFDYQCSAGGSEVSGWAGIGVNICGVTAHPSSYEQAVALPVQALNGQIRLTVSWFAAVSTLGDQEYATSNLAFLGFQDGGGNPVAATAGASAAASVVPEPGTCGLIGLGLAAIIKRRSRPSTTPLRSVQS